MKQENKQVHLEALTSQLNFLKSRVFDQDAAQWRKLGKLAQDFTVWLERARPWISVASSLIALRVEQVMGEVDPQGPSENCLVKLSDLLEEAGRQLAQPGQPIQVIDLNNETNETGESQVFSEYVDVNLPSGLVAIPDMLRPQGAQAVQFLYIITN